MYWFWTETFKPPLYFSKNLNSDFKNKFRYGRFLHNVSPELHKIVFVKNKMGINTYTV